MDSPKPTLPPTGARLDSKLRQARIRASLFQKTSVPLKIGRFVLLERVGAGSMGEVYAAYDDQLDRKVAIKLVRSDFEGSAHANQRLLREAKILARLSHPNVVQIYDVGMFEERVFIAMEFIRGQTMTQWLEAMAGERDKRRVSAILERFMAAGRGLEAGHGAGLTHRDFKPDNILVSDDGRVVVADFGLARLEDLERGAARESEDEPDAALARTNGDPSASPGTLTPRGTALGTPAYMAPEIYRGRVADSRSDQFSFCVALYEALYGERPFQGASLQELRSAITSGRFSFAGRESVAPAAVRKAVARGLSTDPAQRFPDMGKLLRALELRPRRRFILPAVFLALAVAAGAYGYAGTGDGQEACTSADAEMAGVWRAERRDAVERAISGIGSVYALDAWPLVERGLDRYARAWTATHRDACLAHRQGRQSARLLDARMTCLERRLAALDSALSVLEEIDSRSLSSAVPVVENLPAIDDCSDIEALSAEIPPPDDPAEKRRVEELRDRLTRARALESGGRYQDALAIVDQVVAQAEAVGYQPLIAESSLLQGQTTLDMGRRRASIEPLRRALETGLEVGMDELAVEAWARLVFARGTVLDESENLLELSSVIEAIGRRLPDASFARALLFNNLGAVYMARQDRERARDYFERAVAVRRRGGAAAGRTELIHAAQNLAMVTADPTRREELMEGVARELAETLGPSHPHTIRQLVHYASYIADPGRARATLAPACERYRQSGQAEVLDGMLRCLYLLAFLHAEMDEPARAAAVLDELIERIPADAERYRSLRLLARGHALLYRGQYREALSAFSDARAALPEAPAEWWINKDIGDAQLGLGIAHLMLAENDQASAHLERARAVFEELVEVSYNAEYRHRLARVRWALARAKAARGGLTESR